MKKLWLALAFWLSFAPAIAQNVVNQPQYATAYVPAGPGTTWTTNLINRTVSPPNNLNALAVGAITTWTVNMPTVPFDGQIVTIGCPGGNVGALTVAAPSGATIGSGGFSSCTSAQGQSVQYQYQYSSNAWLLLGATFGNTGAPGNVVGPASSVDGDLALFSGTTGKLLVDSTLGSGVRTALGIAANNSGGIATYPYATANLSGLGTNVATALAAALNGTGGLVGYSGALGTPTSGNLANTTGFPAAQLGGLGTGVSAALAAATNATGGFTTVPIATSLVQGTTTNNNAAAGYIGEYISSSIASGSAVSLTTGTAANVTSVSLTAGDWDCQGNVITTVGSGTVTTNFVGWISSASASAPTAPNGGGEFIWNGSLTSNQLGFTIPPTRFSLASTTTVYLGVNANFTTNTLAAFGFIGCRRVR